MSNQTINQRMSGTPHLSGRATLYRIFIAALALGLMILTANQIKSDAQANKRAQEAALTAAPVAKTTSFSTEQYWEMARKSASSVTAPQAEAPAYFTEQYWEMARNTALGSTLPAPEAPAYFTEQYWDMAEQPSAATPSQNEPEWATYTDRYWSLSR